MRVGRYDDGGHPKVVELTFSINLSHFCLFFITTNSSVVTRLLLSETLDAELPLVDVFLSIEPNLREDVDSCG